MRFQILIFQLVILTTTTNICAAGISVRQPRQAKYQIKFRNQLGTHLRQPFEDLATNRFMVDVQQSFDWSSGFSVNVAGRIRSEAAYSSNPEVFTDEQAREDASNVELRDAYMQYKNGPFMFRLGNQQIVWGEAFGFFFADIVNPKDLRENSLSGLFELADLRDPSPFANLQWRGSDWTAQIIYGNTAPKNRMPRWGSPTSAASYSDVGGTESNVTIRTDAEISESLGDTGLRLSKNISGADISLFGFSYIDRMPFYRITSFTPVPYSLTLQEHQTRVESFGSTLTYDFSGYLLRLEYVQTKDRRVNTLINSTIADRPVDETVAVVGLDLPPTGKWNTSVQVSHSSLSDIEGEPIARPKNQPLAGIRFNRDFSSQQSLELMGHWSIDDGSSLFVGRWTFARSSRLEFLMGWEALFGSDDSLFGSVQDSSRLMIGIRGIFSG